MSQGEECPFPYCHMSGTIRRVLSHIREVHDSSCLPSEFVDRLHLHQCEFCNKWFSKLAQHKSKCPERRKAKSVNNVDLSDSASCHVVTPTMRNADLTAAVSCTASLSELTTIGDESISGVKPVSVNDSFSEDLAWLFIRDISVEQLLCTPVPQTVGEIAPSLKSMFQDCCDLALKRILKDPSDEAGWKLFLSIPRMVLCHTRGGSSAIRQARAKFQLFLKFQWSQLLCLKITSSTNSSNRATDSLNKRHKAALQLVRCGELSRAAKLLTSPGLAPTSADVVDKLALKHPVRVKEVPSSHDVPVSSSINLLPSTFFSTLSKLPRGSGSGPSGWKYEHFKALASKTGTAHNFLSLCNFVATGSIPDDIVKLLSASRLIALPKANGDVRPIAVGECLRRLTAKVICQQKKESFTIFFSPLQHGVAVDGGSELLIHHISLLLESHPDWVLLKTDIKNAFNSVERAHLLPEVAKVFPDIYHHVHQMYYGFGPLVFNGGHDTHLLTSQEGVHQGDPLGPALFSVTLHPFILDVQRKHPTIQVLAYLDDIFLVGPLDGVLSGLDDMTSDLQQIGLTVAIEKCEMFCNDQTTASKLAQSFRVVTSGTHILGSPIGHPDYIKESCLEIARSGQNLCNELVSLDDPQSGMLLLRYCHVSRMNHVARTVFPSLLNNAACLHDQLTRGTFQRLVRCHDITDSQWAQATLPIRTGGFGMTAIQSICHIAFVSSWARSLVQLPLSFVGLRHVVENLVSLEEATCPIGSISSELQQAMPEEKCLDDLLRNTNKLQHKLSLEHTNQIVSTMKDNPQSLRDGARFRSLQGIGAGAWLDAIPVSSKFALKPGNFCLATRMRLGCAMPLQSVTKSCECGKNIDGDGYHLTTCKTGGGPVWTHETISNVWSDCLKQLHITHQREPRNRYSNSDDRPDIIAFDAHSGCDIELDISIAHPWAGHTLSQSAIEDGVAAAKREQEKAQKYANEWDIWGNPSNCIPIVFEHFGCWGKQANQFLHHLSLQSVDEDGNPNSHEFKTFWRRCLSVALQRCNASVITRKLTRLCEKVDRDSYINSCQFLLR